MRRITCRCVAGVIAITGTASGADSANCACRRPPSSSGTAAGAGLKESRYQIGQIERLLEGAVEHGATVIRDRSAGDHAGRHAAD